MSVKGDSSPFCLRAIDGKHLGWSEFREKVLSAFSIKCSAGSENGPVPAVLLSNLQLRQGESFDDQRKKWRIEEAAGRGFGWTAVFPPYVLPPVRNPTLVRRLIVPRLTRECLPPRSPTRKDSLYELPTPKPHQICGFNLEAFDKTDQSNLTHPLSISGAEVDFQKGEVFPGETVFCPFLLFERFLNCQEHDIEAARNQCAISGAQCLRGQQQLFHTAYGLKTVSHPLTVYTVAIGNKFAIANIHYVEGDGTFVMAPLCKFNLENDEQYNMFQVWIDSIEHWATGTLLPILRKALVDAREQAKDTPPASPALSTTLSIDTTSDPIPNVMNALRTTWTNRSWHFEGDDDTPVLSSIAACGTPLSTRQTRSLSLNLKSPEISMALRMNKHGKVISPITIEKGWQSPHAPIRPSPFSPRWTPAPITGGFNSPCRPPTLSPCTPPPDAPWTAKNPMLVLRRRLDVATDEVSELRGQVEVLQTELSTKTGRLEKQLSTLIMFQESQMKREQAKEAARVEAQRQQEEQSLQRQILKWQGEFQQFWGISSKTFTPLTLLTAFLVVLILSLGVDLHGTCVNLTFEMVKTNATFVNPAELQALGHLLGSYEGTIGPETNI